MRVSVSLCHKERSCIDYIFTSDLDMYDFKRPPLCVTNRGGMPEVRTRGRNERTQRSKAGKVRPPTSDERLFASDLGPLRWKRIFTSDL